MPSSPFLVAADALLDCESGLLPDLSGRTVLLPHLHAAAPLLAALRQRVEQPVFLPPRLTTLNALARSTPMAGPVESDSLRLAEIRDALARSGLCRARALWPAAEEVLTLMAELSASRLVPAADPDRLLRRIRAAYGGRLARPLELEARLVLELWHALQQGERDDPTRAYARGLARAAQSAPGPLYHLGLPPLTSLEAAFLDDWAGRHPVRHLPWVAALPARRALLLAAWPNQGPDASPLPLGERAHAHALAMPDSPLLPDVRMLAADSLEDEARGAAAWILDRLRDGEPRIAIVALDRLAARRLRALLERHPILARDETGWTFSTASVAHVLDRLLSLARNDGYHLDLLDLFKSPFVFADLEAQARLAAVAELERALRREGVASGWTAILDLARRDAPAAVGLLQRLARARERLGGRRRGLSAWQTDLLAALEDLGVPAALAADTAGRQLLSLLQALGREVAGHSPAYDFPTWREWLFRQLERGTFRDDDIDSPVRLVSPLGARLRDFDAAVVLGADAAHLPPADGGGLFSDRVRAELGLPAMAERQAELRGALTDLLCHVPRVLLTWQARLDGEPNPLSPWLEVLEGFHRLAYDASLKTAATDATAKVRAAGTGGTPPPRPRPARLPGQISASGWQSLVDCPYQYHVRHILGLAEAEDIAEEMEKRDYGELVHAILHEFHARHPCLLAVQEDVLVGDLEAISARQFAPRLAGGYLALGWQMRWRRRLREYVAWARERETSGYAWREGEVARSRDLPLDGARHITLRGRLDRLDEGPLGVAVLDYKTRARQGLSRRLAQPGEDVQLPFYGLLADAAEAAYLALDEARPALLGPTDELAALSAREADRLRATLSGVLDGAALPAHGAEGVCARCEARGLCRRDYWSGVGGDAAGA